MDLISRQAAIDAICLSWCGCQNSDCKHHFDPDVDEYYWCDGCSGVEELKNIPSAEPDVTDRNVGNLISREAMGDALNRIRVRKNETWYSFYQKALDELCKLPSAQPERDIPKRVLWTGWKGYRYTRYNCPNCKKPVRNDDVYCHRCGQRLMFPKISHTPYVEGQKQEVIVRWDDE